MYIRQDSRVHTVYNTHVTDMNKERHLESKKDRKSTGDISPAARKRQMITVLRICNFSFLERLYRQSTLEFRIWGRGRMGEIHMTYKLQHNSTSALLPRMKLLEQGERRVLKVGLEAL